MSAHNHENAMRHPNLATMQFEELWRLYEELANLLTNKIIVEKRTLEGRLAKLDRLEIVSEASAGIQPEPSKSRAPRRPKVLPKYYNPLAPAQKWSGRGKRPKWVVAALEAGQRLDDLKITYAQRADRKKRPRR